MLLKRGGQYLRKIAQKQWVSIWLASHGGWTDSLFSPMVMLL
jgi:hypothetical protein